MPTRFLFMRQKKMRAGQHASRLGLLSRESVCQLRLCHDTAQSQGWLIVERRRQGFTLWRGGRQARDGRRASCKCGGEQAHSFFKEMLFRNRVFGLSGIKRERTV